MSDHAIRYSKSCVKNSKLKGVVVKKVFKNCTGFFGYPEKMMNLKLCENFNIGIFTTTTESPWNNGFNEKHRAIHRLSVSKTIEETKHELEAAGAWGPSAKSSLENVNQL